MRQILYKGYTIEIYGSGKGWGYMIIEPDGNIPEAGNAGSADQALYLARQGVDQFVSMDQGRGFASEARDSAAAEIGAPIAKIVRDEEALAANRALAPEPMESDRDVFLFLASQLGKEDQEVFVVIGLDLNRQLKSYIEIARGQVDRVVVRPEDVVRAVILDNAHGFIVAHNHPSGQAKPSPADGDLTEQIRVAAEAGCPNIVFLDHIVVGDGEWYSFTDKKLKKL